MRKTPLDPVQLRKETREWLTAHTIHDVRGIADDLENAGEDVTKLVDAINDLEALVKEPVNGVHHSRAKAEA